MSERSDSQLADGGTALAESAVAQLLLTECTADGLVALLKSAVAEVQRAAILCLGLRGAMTHSRALAVFLRGDDPRLAQLAETSLWEIWMQAGSRWGNAALAQGVELIRGERFEEAVGVFGDLCDREPTFAEAYHQRGIALCFLDRPAEAAEAFRRALRLNRYHFSAAVSLGHTCVERNDLRGALRHYRYALRIHPHLEGIPEAVQRLETAVGSRAVSR